MYEQIKKILFRPPRESSLFINLFRFNPVDNRRNLLIESIIKDLEDLKVKNDIHRNFTLYNCALSDVIELIKKYGEKNRESRRVAEDKKSLSAKTSKVLRLPRDKKGKRPPYPAVPLKAKPGAR